MRELYVSEELKNYNYVTRNTKNNVCKIIVPPTSEEILDPDFSYTEYANNIIEMNFDMDCDVDSLIYDFMDDSQTNKSNEEKELIQTCSRLYENFENRIKQMQSEYEEKFINGQIDEEYTQIMKVIAKAYFDALKDLENNKIKDNSKMGSFIKDEVQAESTLRIEAFSKGEIKLGQLHPVDLSSLSNIQLGLTKLDYAKLKRYLFANSTEYEMINKEIGQLYVEIKDRKKGKCL